MKLREAFIALNMIEQVGPVRLRKLLQIFGSPLEVLNAGREQLQRVDGIGSATARSISSWESQLNLPLELKKIQQYGVNVLIESDHDYPPLMREIHDPPIVLYVQGKPELLQRNALALVGSRQTTSYGRECARWLASRLAEAGITVISGGARGIDTEAHIGCLDAGGPTIAILGCGLDVVYPAENAGLFRRIRQHGALVSQFPFGRRGDRQTFPVRNRLVAGMSQGTVVIEAGRKSGALITANLAVDYGRQVFAVPGPITSSRSSGCHLLIQEGAKLCFRLEDILNELPMLEISPSREVPPTREQPDLNDLERHIWEQLTDGAKDPDQLLESTHYLPGKMNSALVGMELRGLLLKTSGGKYQRAGQFET